MIRRQSYMTTHRMSTQLAFSDAKFDSNSYSAYRPTYGTPLFDQLLAYHQGRRREAVDLGCGTGQITVVLANHFDRVSGFDTSAQMLTKASARPNVTYAQGEAESLPSLRDGAIDLVTVGQAAHWFTHAPWFVEMARILRPGGTLSFWSYNEAVFTQNPAATEVWRRYSHAEDKLGPHWPQPGRRILESAMEGIEPPGALFEGIERRHAAQKDGKGEVSAVAKEMPLQFAEAYFRTSSAFHGWQTANPGILARKKGGDSRRGDVVDEMMDEIKAVTRWNDDTTVHIHWPTVTVLARKR